MGNDSTLEPVSMLEAIKGRLNNIGGTPWKATDMIQSYYVNGFSVKSWNDADVAQLISEQGEVDFIANAPSDIKYLLSHIKELQGAYARMIEMYQFEVIGREKDMEEVGLELRKQMNNRWEEINRPST